MRSMKIHFLILIALTLFAQTVRGFYAVYDLAPPGAFELLTFIVIFWLIGDWFTRDSKEKNVDWVFDMGFFLYISWPLFIPIYLIKTRGFKVALIAIIGSLFLYVGTYYVSLFAFDAIIAS